MCETRVQQLSPSNSLGTVGFPSYFWRKCENRFVFLPKSSFYLNFGVYRISGFKNETDVRRPTSSIFLQDTYCCTYYVSLRYFSLSHLSTSQLATGIIQPSTQTAAPGEAEHSIKHYYHQSIIFFGIQLLLNLISCIQLTTTPNFNYP